MSRLVVLTIAAALALSGAGCSGCATALLEGTLVADGGGGLAVQAPEGNVIPVRWPSGVGIGHDGDRLTLANPLGIPIAYEGEFVSTGGGQAEDGVVFAACGPIAVRASSQPRQ